MARVVVLGAAGFLGSHLTDFLVSRGDQVVGVDDLSSGSISNITHLNGNKAFSFIRANIAESIPVSGHVDAVLNFASLASPPRYFARQLHTLRTGSAGTDKALSLASEHGARFIMASTSEVYGDPEVHPQPESYKGSVSSIGPRSCYDEAKRYAEALCMAYQNEHATNIGIARIFNTYGPRLDPDDGRVVSNFIKQSLNNMPITIYGDGSQTRSFCYVDDEIRGIINLLDSSEVGPVNIGNPTQFTMLELAELVNELVGTECPFEFHPLPQDDPTQRCPDIGLAKARLGWTPSIDLKEGLGRTITWFRQKIKE